MDGLLLIDKPKGWTSHDVVAKVRNLLKIRAVGHAGTLDPFATGLLVLGVGKGTKQLTALVGVDKEYEAVIRLGATSDTFDTEGVITPHTVGAINRAPTMDEIETALNKFRGGYEQSAPIYSAKKINGKKLYDLARAGKATEEMRPKKQVTISELRITNYEWPNLSLLVKCGSGTYIRSLADDIGRELGVGGYCLELRRTKVGHFDVAQAFTMQKLTDDMPKLLLLAFCLLLGVMPLRSQAVPPPDFIISLGTTLTQFFTLFFLLAATAASTLYRIIRLHLMTSSKRLYLMTALFVLTVGVSIGGTLIYRNYAQKEAMQQVQALEQQLIQTQKEEPSIPAPDEINHASATDVQLASEDAVSAFIRSYYANIGSGHLEQAYQQSQKYVPYATFASWYARTSSVSIDRLQRIDTNNSSLELTLLEKDVSTRYAVLMEVATNTSGVLQIKHSDVRPLGQMASTTSTDPLVITNTEFKLITDQHEKPFLVLDAREDVENTYGRFPGSTHIRFADLKAGRWIELPTDTDVFVLCWSGIRGKEVTQFLRLKNIRARYLEQGANGWVDFGGAWEGNIKFHDQYTEDRYHLIFSTSQVKDSVNAGTVLVDTRSFADYQARHIPGSVNIPMMSTPSVSVEKAMNQVPAGASVLTVCDAYVNCFDAQITGVELERRGHTFLGRYTTPKELY
ncbi:MAG: tRNA pseudouridine(55) synthase TruB [Candidatus Uhrbacteria bacterium]